MDKRERVAAALWRARIEDAGAPQSAINARTPEAFLEGSPDFQMAWLKMADAAIAALEPMDKPRVKPLTFRTVGDGRMALSPVGPYRVLEQPDGLFDVMFDGCLVNRRKKGEQFSSYEAAEAWAQSRHEKQVLECLAALEPVTVQEAARVLLAQTPNPVFDVLKPALIGEFSFQDPCYDEDGEEVIRKVIVPWDTTKKIISAALRALAEKAPE